MDFALVREVEVDDLAKDLTLLADTLSAGIETFLGLICHHSSSGWQYLGPAATVSGYLRVVCTVYARCFVDAETTL